jgi:aspartyl-tRNA(Asn)/glutamyl-tRNA(Gln) amidotransferase subunit C
MSLEIEDVARMAHLARIRVGPDELARTLAQLNDIFAMIEQMRAVDTSGIEPMSHPLGGSQRLRDDAVTETDRREAAMRNAPEHLEGLFLVPKVIE